MYQIISAVLMYEILIVASIPAALSMLGKVRMSDERYYRLSRTCFGSMLIAGTILYLFIMNADSKFSDAATFGILGTVLAFSVSMGHYANILLRIERKNYKLMQD